MNYRNIYMRVAEIVVGMMFIFSGFGKVDSAQMTTMAEITEMVFSCFDEIVDSVSERICSKAFYFYSGVVP